MSENPETIADGEQAEPTPEERARGVPDHQFSVEERRERDRKVFRNGIYLAILGHILFFVFFHSGPNLQSPYAAAGPRAGDDRAAAGGAMSAMQLQIQQTQPIPRPPRPLEVSFDIQPEPVDFEDKPQELSEVLGDMPGNAAEAGEGDDRGPGKDDGTGLGDGGTADEGRFRLMPPVPRGMIMPPTSDNLRGKEVEVWVFVDETGKVVADSTYLVPPTSDGGFNNRLREEAAEWVFRPATRAGQPVASWFPYKISM